MGKETSRRFKGTKSSPEAIEQNRLNHTGDKCHFWKGGVASRDYKEYYRHKCLERWARLKGAEGSYSVDDWMALKNKTGNKCVCCQTPESERPLTRDHIIPLTLGGSNYIDNIQPLCQSCNSRKKNNIIIYA